MIKSMKNYRKAEIESEDYKGISPICLYKQIRRERVIVVCSHSFIIFILEILKNVTKYNQSKREKYKYKLILKLNYIKLMINSNLNDFMNEEFRILIFYFFNNKFKIFILKFIYILIFVIKKIKIWLQVSIPNFLYLNINNV